MTLDLSLVSHVLGSAELVLRILLDRSLTSQGLVDGRTAKRPAARHATVDGGGVKRLPLHPWQRRLSRW